MSEKRENPIETTYQMIVIAAREARRLNELRVMSGSGAGDTEVIQNALDRTERGEVEWRIASVEEAARQAPGGGTRKEDFSFGD